MSSAVVGLLLAAPALAHAATTGASAAAAVPVATADPAASETAKQALLTWLTHLPDRATNRVASGFFGGYSGKTFSLEQTDELTKETGQSPAVLACDYASWTAPTLIDHSCNDTLKTWPGVVSISVHAPNPDRTRDFGDKLTDFSQLTVEGSALRTQWLADLDEIAAGLAELDAAGVPVLFRPMHEMNGRSFWWCDQQPAEFQAVWRDMYRYLTTVKGLHNLLWVYAPISGAGNVTRFYPGDGYADIVGLSAYSADPSMLNGYEELLTLGKPFALTEIGPPTSTDEDIAKLGSVDSQAWVTAIRTRFPATIYFLAWNDKWAPHRNKKAYELFNDPWVVNSAEVDLSAITTSPAHPALVGARRSLGGFESGAKGWAGYLTSGGAAVVTDWAAQGARSLKANVDPGAEEAYLTWSGRTSLAGHGVLSASVRAVPQGAPAAGTTAKLYVRTGPSLTWHDGGSAVVGPDGVVLALRLDGIGDLGDVREIGVRFTPAAGGSAIYLDDVGATIPPKLIEGFEAGAGGWFGDHVEAGPWAVREWAAEGTRSLKADVDLGAKESGLITRTPAALGGFTSLSVRVRTAAWGNQATGSLAKLYLKSGPNSDWRDAGSTLVGPDGTTLVLNIAGVVDAREVGVYVAPAPGASGISAIYLDRVTAS